MLENIQAASADPVWQARLFKGCMRLYENPNRGKIFQGAMQNQARCRTERVGHFRIFFEKDDQDRLRFRRIEARDKCSGRGFKH